MAAPSRGYLQELWHRCFQQFALSSLLAGRRRDGLEKLKACLLDPRAVMGIASMSLSFSSIDGKLRPPALPLSRIAAMAGRVLIVFDGTRGDAQPYIVAAKALIKGGLEVMVTGPGDASRMAEEFQVPFVRSRLSAQKVMAHPDITKQMANPDDPAGFVTSWEKKKAEFITEGSKERDLGSLCTLIQDWKPDLVLFGAVLLPLVGMIIKVVKVPVVSLTLQHGRMCKTLKPMWSPDWLPRFMWGQFWRFLVFVMAGTEFKQSGPALSKLLGVPMAQLRCNTNELSPVDILDQPGFQRSRSSSCGTGVADKSKIGAWVAGLDESEFEDIDPWAPEEADKVLRLDRPKAMAERLEHIRRRLVRDSCNGRDAPVDFLSRARGQLASSCCRDEEFWNDQVRHPAAAWVASRSKGNPLAPAEQIAMSHFLGGIESLEADKENKDPRKRQSNRDKRQAKAKRQKAEREELDRLRRGQNGSGPGQFRQWRTSSWQRAGEIDCGHAGFPCGSFSMVRHRPGGPPPVRDLQNIYGCQRKRRVAWTIENPPGSETQAEGPAWKLPEVENVINKFQCTTAWFNSCAFQQRERVRWLKPAQFGGRLAGLESLRRKRNWLRDFRHESLLGKAKTFKAARYPVASSWKLIIKACRATLNLEWWCHRGIFLFRSGQVCAVGYSRRSPQSSCLWRAPRRTS
eukprot:s3474_g1.t1